MAIPAFDTLKFAERLMSGGFDQRQAIAISEAQRDAFNEALDTLMATKSDIKDVKGDIEAVKSEMKVLEAKISIVDSKIGAVDSKLNWLITLVSTIGVIIAGINLWHVFHP